MNPIAQRELFDQAAALTRQNRFQEACDKLGAAIRIPHNCPRFSYQCRLRRCNLFIDIASSIRGRSANSNDEKPDFNHDADVFVECAISDAEECIRSPHLRTLEAEMFLQQQQKEQEQEQKEGVGEKKTSCCKECDHDDDDIDENESDDSSSSSSSEDEAARPYVLRAKAASCGLNHLFRKYVISGLVEFPKNQELRQMLNECSCSSSSSTTTTATTSPSSFSPTTKLSCCASACCGSSEFPSSQQQQQQQQQSFVNNNNSSPATATTSIDEALKMTPTDLQLECPICTDLFVEPVTTACAHTFCRSCLSSVLDHSTMSAMLNIGGDFSSFASSSSVATGNSSSSSSSYSQKCPLCRAPLHVDVAHHPVNTTIEHICQTLFRTRYRERIREQNGVGVIASTQQECQSSPNDDDDDDDDRVTQNNSNNSEQQQERRKDNYYDNNSFENDQQHENNTSGIMMMCARPTYSPSSSSSTNKTNNSHQHQQPKKKLINIPLFLCEAISPGHIVGLNVFEPRYRLLIRRVLKGSRQFALMEAYWEQQDSPYCPIGTIVTITDANIQADGRIIVCGTSGERVKIHSSGEVDGYRVGVGEIIEDDLPENEEEASNVATLCRHLVADAVQRVVRNERMNPPPCVNKLLSAPIVHASSISTSSSDKQLHHHSSTISVAYASSVSSSSNRNTNNNNNSWKEGEANLDNNNNNNDTASSCTGSGKSHFCPIRATVCSIAKLCGCSSCPNAKCNNSQQQKEKQKQHPEKTSSPRINPQWAIDNWCSVVSPASLWLGEFHLHAWQSIGTTNCKERVSACAPPESAESSSTSGKNSGKGGDCVILKALRYFGLA